MNVILKILAFVSVFFGSVMIYIGAAATIVIGLLFVSVIPIFFISIAEPKKKLRSTNKSKSVKTKTHSKKDPVDTSWLWAVGISFLLLSTYLWYDLTTTVSNSFGDTDFGVGAFITGIIGVTFIVKAFTEDIKKAD